MTEDFISNATHQATDNSGNQRGIVYAIIAVAYAIAYAGTQIGHAIFTLTRKQYLSAIPTDFSLHYIGEEKERSTRMGDYYKAYYALRLIYPTVTEKLCDSIRLN